VCSVAPPPAAPARSRTISVGAMAGGGNECPPPPGGVLKCQFADDFPKFLGNAARRGKPDLKLRWVSPQPLRAAPPPGTCRGPLPQTCWRRRLCAGWRQAEGRACTSSTLGSRERVRDIRLCGPEAGCFLFSPHPGSETQAMTRMRALWWCPMAGCGMRVCGAQRGAHKRDGCPEGVKAPRAYAGACVIDADLAHPPSPPQRTTGGPQPGGVNRRRETSKFTPWNLWQGARLVGRGAQQAVASFESRAAQAGCCPRLIPRRGGGVCRAHVIVMPSDGFVCRQGVAVGHLWLEK
jgi:hypothetical protein